MKYSLRNFEHGFLLPMKFSIGPFIINIEKTHCANLALIPTRESHRYTNDEYGNPLVQAQPATGSGWVETAILETEIPETSPSLLLPDSGFRQRHDICFILAFLTGRGISTDDELVEYFSERRLYESFVRPVDYPSAANKLLAKISSGMVEKSKNGLYQCILSFGERSFDGRATHIFSSLNLAYDLAYDAKANRRKYPQGAARDSLLLDFKKVTESHISDIELKAEVQARLSNLLSPSAFWKLLSFTELVLGVKIADNAAQKRVKLIDQTRNAIFHNGTLPKDSKLNQDEIMRVSAFSIMFATNLVYLYFVKFVFAIETYQIDKLRTDTIEFVQSGKFRGMDIQAETFEDYLQRQEDEWINQHP